LDEAHVAAPASASKYAIDSRITRTIRDIAHRFENRLFLSATPHNGHSNSFSALLEILDPQRFTRGVPVTDPEELEPVLVRRLKSDLRALGKGKFPERRVLAVDLVHDRSAWTQCIHELRDGERRQVHPEGDAAPAPLDGAASADPLELQLAEELAAYRDRLESGLRKRERLVLASLQKRLLSSPEAFYRTLQVHARGLRRRAEAAETDAQAELEATAPTATDVELAADTPSDTEVDDEYGTDEEQVDAAEAETIERESLRLANRYQGQLAHVERMLQLATTARGVPDAKTLALVDWIRRCQCSGASIGGSDELSVADRRWRDRRAIVFTEYGDTKRYLLQVLRTAIRGTDREDERILQFHGGMSDEQREQIQQAFNDPRHPVRILVATDAAREGVNLQGSCADLFHYDIPWNPARMEQRNGRIDRTLQESEEVRCHYFRYPQRAEDVVLETLVHKVETIRKELGSLGAVVLDRLEAALEQGIRGDTLDALSRAEELGGRRETARTELETQRELESMRREIDEVSDILNASRDHTGFDAEALRQVVRAGLELNGLDDLEPLETAPEIPSATAHSNDPPRHALPPFPASWQGTLDTLRPPRRRDEPLWEWRRRPPPPVIFEPLDRLDSTCAQLHLQHPFVKRLLQRFLAQGYSAHDLARVTVLRNESDSRARAIVLGRLTLFGARAARLYDELVAVAAPWLEAGGDRHLQPFAERADRRAVESLWQLLAEPHALDDVPETARRRLRDAAGGDFRTLWPAVRDEADHRAHEAARLLEERGRREAEQLRGILARQRHAIERRLAEKQLALDFTDAEKAQRDQLADDLQHMERRLAELAREATTEPKQIEELYRVTLKRLEPVGLVYLWPVTKG
ncbi:MAG TPA: DISARM system SNF2-like helicase DrmD, partial [Planctomycetota bacterium]|nr:DISARM system SNF2-like helicase DrmD [Planctomycetota bacterium]